MSDKESEPAGTHEGEEKEPEVTKPPATQNEEPEKSDEALDRAEEKDESYLDQLKRTQADLENLRKRMESERARIIESANESLVTGLLETVDNFERALASMEESGSPDLDGVRMVFEGLMRTLRDAGLERVDANGQFDPHRHEAVMQTEVDDESQDGAVLEEFQTGYALRNRVIRPSKVRVAKYVSDIKNDNNIKEEE